MIKIGRYNKNGNGDRFLEIVTCTSFMTFAVIEKKDKNNEKAPDFTIDFKGIEIGSLWKKMSKNGNSYLFGQIANFATPTGQSKIMVLFNDKKDNFVYLITDEPVAGGTDENTF